MRTASCSSSRERDCLDVDFPPSAEGHDPHLGVIENVYADESPAHG